MSEETYLAQLQALLPPGTAWPRESDAEHTLLLGALAVEFARIDARAADLLRESNPHTAVELLPEWEALCGVTPDPAATIDDRQLLVWAKYFSRGDIKKPYYVALAASMGYTIRIDDYTPSMSDWLCAGDELVDEPWAYFTAGISMAGDYLAYEYVITPWFWEIVVLAVPDAAPSPDLETVLNDLKPAHMLLNFTYL